MTSIYLYLAYNSMLLLVEDIKIPTYEVGGYSIPFENIPAGAASPLEVPGSIQDLSSSAFDDNRNTIVDASYREYMSIGPDSSTGAADVTVEFVNVAPTDSESSACSVVDQPGIIIPPFTLCEHFLTHINI